MIVIDRETADLAIPATVRFGLPTDHAYTALSGEHRIVVSAGQPIAAEFLRAVVNGYLIWVRGIPARMSSVRRFAVLLSVLRAVRGVPLPSRRVSLIAMRSVPFRGSLDLLLAGREVIGARVRLPLRLVFEWHELIINP